ncbi:MAG: hypothetical protein E7476_03615 [Ruminococcaceae bacterium]|nr:hypothetical protein [Oscillospiraceae bacterium]
MVKRLALILSASLLLNVMGAISVSAESNDNGNLKWIMPPQGTSAGETVGHAYDIRALVNASEKSTTYGNGGYYVRLMSESFTGTENAYNFNMMSKNVEKYLSANGTILSEVIDSSQDDYLGVKVSPSFISGQDKAIEVTFTVTNYTAEPQTFSLGSGADVQVGDNDSADVTMLNGTGFTMLEGNSEDSLRYVFLGKKTTQFPQITNVDNMWVDAWDTKFYQASAFSNKQDDLTDTDSAMAFSWVDRVINANESLDFKVVYLLGIASEIELPGAVAKPQASPAAGTYITPQNVTLSSATEGANIYYTLDGTDPTSSSTLYTDTEISIENTTTLKAIAIKDDILSEVSTFSYTIGSSVVRGTVKYENDSPVEGASVKIKKGNTTVAGPVTTENNGSFDFADVPSGTYNLIIEKDGITVTKLLIVEGNDITIETIIPLGKKATIFEVAPGAPDVASGGLDNLFNDSENFTADDQQHLDDGNIIEFKLRVEGSESPDAQIADSVENAVSSNDKIGNYLNINLFKILKDNSNNELNTLSIHSVSNEITLVISIPDELKGKGPYKVIRAHEDPDTGAITTDVLEDLDGNDSDDFITIKTDRFSIYAITYTVSGSTNGSKGEDSSDSDDDDDEKDWTWPEVVRQIDDSKSGNNIKITVTEDTMIPVSVFRALRDKDNVTLTIRYASKKVLTIPSNIVETPQKNRFAYPMSLLIELYGNTKTVQDPVVQESPVLETSDKTIPSTGAHGGNPISGLLLFAVMACSGYLVCKKR